MKTMNSALQVFINVSWQRRHTRIRLLGSTRNNSCPNWNYGDTNWHFKESISKLLIDNLVLGIASKICHRSFGTILTESIATMIP